MRLASWSVNGRPTWGALLDGTAADLGSTGASLAESLRSAIATGILSGLTPAQLAAAPHLAVDELVMLPVIPDPAKIICVGVNYGTHLAETKRETASAPTIFTRFADTQAADGAAIEIPSVSDSFDYEGELAVIIGRPAWRVDVAQAMDHVAGYSIYNDFTARDWQRKASQWIPGKNFPGSGSFGPALVPSSEFPDVTNISLETRVNGHLRQKATVGEMVFDLPALICYISAFTPLEPGDVIVSGTPGGVGAFMDPPTFLQPGDVVEVTVSGIGTLRNVMVAPASAP